MSRQTSVYLYTYIHDNYMHIDIQKKKEDRPSNKNSEKNYRETKKKKYNNKKTVAVYLYLCILAE